MQKKIMIACVAITAFAAFVVAPVASASPELTEGGSTLAVGTSLKATNTGSVLFTSSIKVECSHAELGGTVTKNSGSSIAANMGKVLLTGPAGSPCSSSAGSTDWTMTSPLCWETISGDRVSVTGCGGNVTFTLDMTSAGITCGYSAASLTGTYLTSADATVNIFEQPVSKVHGGVFCPSSGKIDMDLDFTTTDGTTLSIS